MFLQASTTAMFDAGDLRLIAPEIILTVCACVALVMSVILPRRQNHWAGYFALAGLALTAVSVVALWWLAQSSGGVLMGFYDTVKIDGFAVVFKLIFLISAALTVAISIRYLDVEGEQRGEYYA